MGEPFLAAPRRGPRRFVGEAIVAVVAETLPQAVDACAEVVVDYDPRPIIVDPTTPSATRPCCSTKRAPTPALRCPA
jgi:CO/xanthine dehydrogenase Mo-binding subunit